MNNALEAPIDWSKYLIEEDQHVSSEPAPLQSEKPQESEKQIDWSKYLDEGSKFQIPEPIRHVARTGARIVETLAGLPGDTIQFAKMVLESLPETPKFLKEDPNYLQKKGQELLESLPTSEDLKAFSSEMTQGFTDPQNAEEEFGDEIFSLGTAVLTGMKDPTKFKSLMKALGLSTAAKTTGKGIELYGGGKTTQASGEIGLLMIASLFTRRYADAFVRSKYQRARASIPQGTMLPTAALISDLNILEIDLRKGLPSTSVTKPPVLNSISELKNKISGGAAPAEEIVESYHDINEKLNSKKLFDELNTSERKKLRSRYDLLKGKIDSTLNSYGQQNPAFYKEWKEANEAYSVLAKSKSTKEFILSNMKSIPGHVMTGMAIKMFMGLPALTSVGAGFAVYQTGKMLSRIAQSPSLRHYYLEVLNAAQKENAPQMIKNLSKLEKGLEQEKD